MRILKTFLSAVGLALGYSLVASGAIPDAATVADRWANAAGMAQTRFTEGVQNTAVDPTALAVAQQAKMQQNVVAAISSGKWARGLQSVGKAGWQSATLAKASNYATGIAAAKAKYTQAIGPVLAVEASLQSQIRSMPSTTIQERLARANAWAMGLYNWAQNR